ncbi:MAG: 4-hydroxy-3-methylbut-2-enyl diphosphate reductase [Alicyclobacillus sp.]|nr:4-hydroxy-3-methylbut-2-enyl diphosphate reductase [Alicyclobacillus sp.]
MRVIRITPRGYCHGVVGAMNIVQSAVNDPTLPRPIYIVGMIVHNRHVVDAFDSEGVITLDGASRMALLDQANGGTVIFTAHGVSPAVRKRAAERGLHVLDATCPDVTRTHDLIRDRVTAGYDIIYIGRKGHPEPEGAVGIAPGRVHLIETEADLEALTLPNDRIAVTNQTTLSQWDTTALIEKVKARYPTAEVYNEICMATQLRQQAVAEFAGAADLCIVVGDTRSNNSNRLVQVSQEIAGTPARLVSSVDQIDPNWLLGKQTVAVTSGASTPTAITRSVIEYLEQFDGHDLSTWEPKATVADARIFPKPRIAVRGVTDVVS